MQVSNHPKPEPLVIEFNCPTCGKKLSGRDEHAGRSLRCPSCKEPMRVPGVPAKALATKAPPSADLTPQQMVSEISGSRLPKRGGKLAIASVCGVLIAALAVFGIVYYSKSQPSKSELPKTVSVPAPQTPPVVAQPDATKSRPIAAVVPKPLEKPAESKKVRAFKEKVAHYLEEARAGTKLLTLAPSLSEAKGKAEHITDLYTHLPDVPSELDPTGEVAERLKNINGSFAAGEFFIQTAKEFQRLGATKEWKKIHEEDIPKLVKEVKGYCEEIESRLGLDADSPGTETNR
jgi:hypothetical protein